MIRHRLRSHPMAGRSCLWQRAMGHRACGCGLWRPRRRGRLPAQRAPRTPSGRPTVARSGSLCLARLERLDVGGSAPQTLAPVSIGRGATWNAQGVILFSSGAVSPFSRISANGGATTMLPLLGKNAAGNESPVFLPDGRHFVFMVRSQTESGTYLGSLDGGAAVRLTAAIRLTSDASPIAYLPSGWLLWIRAGGTLVAQRLDVARSVLVGEPVSLADGVLSVSASATGVVAYRVSGNGQRQLTWVDRSGAVQGTVGPPDGSLLAPRLSPDGRQVAFSRETQGKTDIWLQDDTRATRMTFGSGNSTYPVWSPDGSRLAFLSGAGHEPRLLSKVRQRRADAGIVAAVSKGTVPCQLVRGWAIPAVFQFRSRSRRGPLGPADDRNAQVVSIPAIELH